MDCVLLLMSGSRNTLSLTPVRNVIDAQSNLYKPRSTGQDREDVVIYLAHTFDPFTRSLERKSIGAAGLGTVGEINPDDIDLLILETGVAGTGAVGTETIQTESNPSSFRIEVALVLSELKQSNLVLLKQGSLELVQSEQRL
jgi:hypothetical protein